MSKISEILREKGNAIWSIGPANTVFQAIEMMALRGVGALTVLSDQGVLVGIISERDYARKVILQGKSSSSIPVSEIMTPDPVCVGRDSKVAECMSLMTEKRIRHLPVVDAERSLIGMISVGDLVKSIITEQTEVIDHLERYIKGEATGVS